jgi:Na+-driven multidrug efflux pump
MAQVDFLNIFCGVDTAMIGRLADKALAGTGFASVLFFVSFSMTAGIAGATFKRRQSVK